MALRERYAALVAAGEIESDPAQAQTIEWFEALLGRLKEKALARKGNALGWLFGSRAPQTLVKGLYLWGDVGRGKTMLMDLFYDSVPARIAKRRVHFNAFMNDVRERIFRHRNDVKAGEAKGDDPIPPVADALATEATLLCFDEFSVTDIADAMILGRLFTRLFDRNVVVVATSNVAPDRLYESGLNRALFLPFIDLLKTRMDVVKLDARTDYRLEKLSGGSTYLVGPGAGQAMDAAFIRLTGGAQVRPRILTVKGRELTVERTCMGVARLSFAELCERPLGSADYLALAETFHTLFVDDVPVMRAEQRDEAKRFITLVDNLYDRGTKLVLSAAAEPAALYPAAEGREAFEFQRTVSRLIEMRSDAYLARPHNVELRRANIVET
jgi:cell division protein ZapE